MEATKKVRIKIWYQQPAPFSEEAEAVSAYTRQNLINAARDGVQVDVKWTKKGASTGGYAYGLAYNALYVAQRVYEAERKGYDAAVIGCVADPGLTEARGMVNIPVTGACESALLLACCLGAKFSIIAHHRAIIGTLVNLVRRYGLTDRLANIVTLGLGGIELMRLYKTGKLEQLIQILEESADKTITEDGAEVIIPGCTMLSTALTAQGVHAIKGVPVIDPALAALKMAEVFVDMQRNLGTGVCRGILYSTHPRWDKGVTSGVS